jgi:hypothetical protein
MSFQKMKKSRPSTEELQAAFDKLKNTGSFQDDPRYWYPKRDEKGNGYAVIRFLPPQDDEDVPFIRTFKHGFNNSVGKFFTEPCPTTIGKECPICEANGVIVQAAGGWVAANEDVKKLIRERKRQMQYVSNIYIVEDAKSPENEGTVRLFRYGKKIMDMLEAAIDPQFGEEAIKPFDMWEGGANFNLKIRKVDNQTNYDLSVFGATCELLSTDKEREAVYNQEHQLLPLIAPELYKEYDELKVLFDRAIGASDQAKEKLQSAISQKSNGTAKASALQEVDIEEDVSVELSDDDDIDFEALLAAD